MKSWAWALVPLLALAQQAPVRDGVIGGVKELERSLGFPATGNFVKGSDQPAASYRCYYTGKLELPESYDDLKLRQISQRGCAIDAAEYDVFFYPIEAVASGKTPVTAGLAAASMERLLMVVPHEDYHDALRKLPAAVGEAAATLVGFLTAAEFARERFGPDADASRNLAREPELFLRKANLVNRYYQELSSVYRHARSGELSVAAALAHKQQAFTALARECGAIEPEPRSFNRCLGANNNAGLAFDATYTRYYPLVYTLYLAQRQNFRATLDKLQQVSAAGKISEAEAVRLLEAAASAR